MSNCLYTLYKHAASSNTSKLLYTHVFNLHVIMDDRTVNKWWKTWTLKILPTVLLLLLCDYPCYNRFPCKLFQNEARWYGWLECQSDQLLWMIAASRDKNIPTVKAQGTGGSQFDYPMTVSHNSDVDNTATPTFSLIKT